MMKINCLIVGHFDLCYNYSNKMMDIFFKVINTTYPDL